MAQGIFETMIENMYKGSEGKPLSATEKEFIKEAERLRPMHEKTCKEKKIH